MHTDTGMKAFRVIDYCAILALLAVAAYSINLFRLDLFQSLDARKDEPLGIIIIKKNIVQRRLSDRVVWDRLFANSPVYSGDLIRVAELSAATLDISENRIDLNENTLIRIQRMADNETPLRLELSEGLVSLAAGGDIALSVAGCQLQVPSGTALTVSTGKDGTAVQINEGSAQFSGEGLDREIASGEMVTLDSGGTEYIEKAVVLMSPRPNARYMQSAGEPMTINFTWNRISLENNDTLLLEAARDRNFTQSVFITRNLYDSAQAAFEAGQWYWRLSLENKILKQGRFTVTEAAAPVLISPVADSLFRYQSDPPNMLFQWSEIADVSFYIMEVCDSPDFIRPQISRQLTAASFVYPNMEAGTWYWRIRPVFPSLYNNIVIYSSVASFRIEHARDPLAPVLELPELQFASQKASPKQADTEAVSTEETPPPLPAPTNRLPENGYRIGVDELKTQRSVIFSWAPVAGANGYIVTLYQQTANGRQQITRREMEDVSYWTMTDLSVLDKGTFIWQIEAVSRNRAGTIERQGRIGENRFIIDIPDAAEVQVQDAGALYGN